MSSADLSRPPARNPTESTYNRACDACRQHKVRCLLPESDSNSRKCHRCAKTDKECLFTAPQKRKQRKRTDARVAELEREVHAMRALFEKKVPADLKATPPTQSPASSESHHFTNADTFVPESKSLWPQKELQGGGNPVLSFQNVASQQIPPLATTQTSDVIERGIISLDQARTLFDIYVKDLVTIFPAVPLSQFRSVEELRTTRPVLFLAVMAASSGKLDPTLYSILQSETIFAYAYRTLMLGEKSLELVQAMLVTVIWYYPPGKFSQLKFYEYIHMAATMAVDIGIGSTPSSRLRRAETDSSSTRQETLLHNTPIGSDAEDLEKRRTFVACYIFAAGAAVNLRRPNMLRFNSRISDCIETLSNSPYSSSFDKRIASWGKLISIAEEVSSTFSFDDPGAIPSLSEPRVQLMLKGFERELEVWRSDMNPTNKDASLMLMYHNANIFMHELALHIDHLPEDFRPPYRLDKISSDGYTKVNTSQYIDAITACILSAQATLDIFLGTDIETLRAFPVFNYVRAIYAVVVLIKLHASTSSFSSPISGAIDIRSLKLEFYLDSLIDHLMLAVGSVEFRSAFMFVGALMRLRSYYKQQKDQENSGNHLQPMSLFGLDGPLLPNRASIESPRDYSTPLSTGLNVIRMPGEIHSDGDAAALNEYREQTASTASPQFFDSSIGIDDDMMAIFNDIGQSFDGDINAWEPQDMNNPRSSSEMDNWNVLF